MKKQDLIRAICKQNLEGVDAYIRGGGDVNELLYDGMTPLVFALDICSFTSENSPFDAIIGRLIEAGSDVNAKHPQSGKTVIMLAIERSRNNEIILRLLNAGSDVTSVCTNGKTALIYLIETGYDKTMIREFLNKGAVVNEPSEGYTALFCAARVRNDADIIEILLKSGASIDSFSVRKILLDLCCKEICKIDDICKKKRIVDILIGNGIDIKATDDEGNTVIHLVSCNYVINLARKRGVSIESKNIDEMTPLLHALIEERIDKVNDLLLLGANPNCVDSDGSTPLHYSDVMLSIRCVSLLLFHGADLLAKNGDGYTPIDLIYEDITIYNDVDYECGIKALIKHYLLYVDKNGLYSSFRSITDRRRREHFLCFIGLCKREIWKMRKTILKKGLSFYTFCQSKNFYRSKFIRIEIDEYKFDYENISSNFPIFEDFILMRLKDNSRKKFKHDLIEHLENIKVQVPINFEPEFRFELKYDSWKRIGKYLNFKQLYKLYLASFD